MNLSKNIITIKELFAEYLAAVLEFDMAQDKHTRFLEETPEPEYPHQVESIEEYIAYEEENRKWECKDIRLYEKIGPRGAYVREVEIKLCPLIPKYVWFRHGDKGIAKRGTKEFYSLITAPWQEEMPEIL